MAWYYNRNNQQTGPVDEAAIKELIHAGTITGNTMVWQDGMDRWQPALATPLAALLPQQGPPPITPPSYAAVPNAQEAKPIRQIRLYFMLYWIFMVAGAAVMTLFGITLFGLFLGFIVGMPLMITGIVFGCLLLYKLWGTVQDGQAETTPGKAVGFLFIPFFNFYWQFVAFWGLSKDLNRYVRQHNLAAPPANEALVLTGCILFCCVVVPCFGILAAIAVLVIDIIALKGMCDTAAAIIQQGPSA
jgi:hypothetical protein